MNQSTMEAYAEIDTILEHMDKKIVNEIPKKLRMMFKEKKAKDYNKTIDPNISLKEQNLKKETLSILAVLNYNYWCKDDNKKQELIQKYIENGKKREEELKKKYNYEDIFENNRHTKIKEESKENTDLITTNKIPWYQKLKNKILKIFKII